MPRTSRMRIATIAAIGVALLAAGCSSGQETPAAGSGSSPAPTGGPLTIALLQKQGDQQYFVDEAQGAKDMAAKLGDVQIKVVDLGTDANKAISEIDNSIAQKVSGIIVVVPDQQIGPQVIDAAKAAGIPLVAADDSIKDSTGAAAPFVGFDGTSMGTEVGKKAGELFKAAGWTAAPQAFEEGAVLTTPDDGPAPWLRAGMALERMLLVASAEGIAASFVNQPLEHTEQRGYVRAIVGIGHPQQVIRFGRPVAAGPRTPRRSWRGLRQP